MVDIVHLSVPIGGGAIAYTVYGLLNLVNTVTSQYVIKMSYSKDKVINCLLSNFYSLKELIYMEQFTNKSIKWHIYRFYLLIKDQESEILVPKMMMVYGE
jgi:hypothetical protein